MTPKQKWLYSVILLFIAAQINFKTRKNGWSKKGKKLSMKMKFLEKVTFEERINSIEHILL